MASTGQHRRSAGARWECPQCGARLVSRNLAHSCGDYSIEKFLAGKSKIGCTLFKRFVALVGKCRPFDIAPAKARVALLSKVRFASVNRVNRDSIDVHFVLPRAVRSGRFRRVEPLGKLHVHHLRFASACDFDNELADWLLASYVDYGERAWLEPRRAHHTPGDKQPRTHD